MKCFFDESMKNCSIWKVHLWFTMIVMVFYIHCSKICSSEPHTLLVLHCLSMMYYIYGIQGSLLICAFLSCVCVRVFFPFYHSRSWFFLTNLCHWFVTFLYESSELYRWHDTYKKGDSYKISILIRLLNKWNIWGKCWEKIDNVTERIRGKKREYKSKIRENPKAKLREWDQTEEKNKNDREKTQKRQKDNECKK